MGRDNVKFAPYVSADFISATLDSYAETGSSAGLLSYDQIKFNALSGVVGLRGSIDIPMEFGTLTPNARVEYRQTRTSAYVQAMHYSDLGPALCSTFSQREGTQGMVTGAISIRLAPQTGLPSASNMACRAEPDRY